jgi:hypothetical protein
VPEFTSTGSVSPSSSVSVSFGSVPCWNSVVSSSPSLSSSLSQTSPNGSLSKLAWFEFGTVEQLSETSTAPSPSSSVSQTLPWPSPSVSAWFGFEAVLQLSFLSFDPSASVSASSGLVPWPGSSRSITPSLSSSASQALPSESPSVLSWSLFATRSQLSVASGKLSLSSFWSFSSIWPSLSTSESST